MGYLMDRWSNDKPELDRAEIERRQREIHDDMLRRERDLKIVPFEQEDQGPATPPPSWDDVKHYDTPKPGSPYLH